MSLYAIAKIKAGTRIVGFRLLDSKTFDGSKYLVKDVSVADIKQYNGKLNASISKSRGKREEHKEQEMLKENKLSIYMKKINGLSIQKDGYRTPKNFPTIAFDGTPKKNTDYGLKIDSGIIVDYTGEVLYSYDIQKVITIRSSTEIWNIKNKTAQKNIKQHNKERHAKSIYAKP